MRSKIKSVTSTVLVVLFCIGLPVCGYGAAPGEILSTHIDGESAVVYIQGPVEEIKSVRIGTGTSEDFKMQPVQESGDKIHTIILLDNSLSIQEKNRKRINELVSSIFASRMPNEEISLATFSTEAEWKVNDSGDYTVLKRALDGVTYQNQDSYLIPMLYKVLSERIPQDGYTRIIIASDGASDEEIGYSMNELNAKLKERPVPVYCFGSRTRKGTNNKELENLFSVSRFTKADYWLVDDITDVLQVASAFSADSNIIKVEAKIPASLQDGTEKGLQLKLSVDGQDRQQSTSLVMPFGTIKETKTETASAAAAPADITKPAVETLPAVPKQKTDKSGSKNIPVILFAVVGIILAAGGFAVIKKSGKGKTSQEEKEEGKDTEGIDEPGETLPLKNEKRDTLPIWGAPVSAEKIRLCGVNNNMEYQTPVKDKIIIGRDSSSCDVCIDESHVSHKHCYLHYENGRLYVAEFEKASRNGTFVDGIQVLRNEIELDEDSILKLGKLEFRVNLIND